MYYRNQKNRTTEPPSHFAELPRVTIQLPIFNEQFVVDRLVEAICKIEYPRDKLDIQVPMRSRRDRRSPSRRGPSSSSPSAAMRWPISDVNSLHIDASWLGIRPAFCMLHDAVGHHLRDLRLDPAVGERRLRGLLAGADGERVRVLLADESTMPSSCLRDADGRCRC